MRVTFNPIIVHTHPSESLAGLSSKSGALEQIELTLSPSAITWSRLSAWVARTRPRII